MSHGLGAGQHQVAFATGATLIIAFALQLEVPIETLMLWDTRAFLPMTTAPAAM